MAIQGHARRAWEWAALDRRVATLLEMMDGGSSQAFARIMRDDSFGLPDKEAIRSYHADCIGVRHIDFPGPCSSNASQTGVGRNL